MDPLVSIKIASYNHERFIGHTIQSVLDQTYQNFELIIIDDSSSDNSVEIIRSFNDPRIFLQVNERNIGAAATSQKANAFLHGKYFCSLDSDDCFHPDKLAKQVGFMEAHPDVDLLATFVHEIDRQGSVIADPVTENWFNRDQDSNLPENWLWENHLCHSSVLMKRKLHEQLWAYESGLPYTNDWHNWIRFMANGAKFSILPEKLTYYRNHGENVTHKNPYRSYWEYAYISARVFHPFLSKIGRQNLIRKNIERFFHDDRYPDSKLGREYFLRLLLNLGLEKQGFLSIWQDFLNRKELPDDDFHEVTSLIEEMRQDAIESRQRIDSMRIDAQRAENEIFKVGRLADTLINEKFSAVKLAKIAYLTSASIVPDIIKWPLRPLIAVARQRFRRLTNQRGVRPCQVRLSPPLKAHRPKIVHAIANFMTGGSSRLVVDIIENLSHLYEQQVISGFIPAPPAYIGCAAHEYRSLFEIRAYLEKYKPDIVHVHYWGDKDWVWYDKILRVSEQIGCKIIENVNTPTTPYVAAPIQRYVYVSNYVMEAFDRTEDNSSVIYPGSDFDLFTRNNLNEVPDNCIGMVYRLESDKLNFAAIEPFILVAKRRPGTSVLIVGEGYYLDHFKRMVAEHGVADSFQFTGAVPYIDLPALYAQMSVFVAPVWKESFGQVTPFAMSMELPVAGYVIGALREILGDDSLLAPPGDSERLAEIIIKLLDDRAKRLAIGKNNRQRALSLFSVEAMIQSYEHVYHTMIEEGI